MSRMLHVTRIGFVALCAVFLMPVSGASVSASIGTSCPVLYRYSQHGCYGAPTTPNVVRAEQQMPLRVVSPMTTVRRFTALPLTSVIVDRTRRNTGALHVWIINYVFGRAPNLGLPSATVSRSARFLVIGESVGRIMLQVEGVNVYDKPQFERIRVNSHGRTIWHISVNLPHRNASLVIHSTLPRSTLESLATALMQQSG